MPATPSLEIVDIRDLLPLIPGTTLGSAAIDLTLVKAAVKAPVAVNASPDLNIVIQAGSQVTLTALNAAKTDDPDRVVARQGIKTAAGDLAPQLLLAPENAWLKYRVEARAEAGAALDSGWFAGSVGSSGTVVTNDYRRHGHDAAALAAIKADIEKGPRFAVSLKDVLALDPGDAVSLNVGGELTAKVSISWSDIFTSQLGTLTRVIRSTSPVGIKSLVGARVEASVKLTDQFVLAFSRLDDTRWRVGLKKGPVSQIDFGLHAGVDVEIDNPDALAQMLSGLVGDLLNRPFADIQALLAKTSLSESDLESFAEVFHRLGLSSTPTIAEVRQAVERLQAAIADRITTVVKEKIAVGFAYEYRRVASDALLLQATMTKVAVEAHHPALTRGRLDGFVDAITKQGQQTQPIAIEQYLNEKSVTSNHAWGFTLGVGKWTVVGRDRKSATAVRRMTVDGLHEQRSYSGFGEYTGDVFGEKQSWHIDFMAEMPQFSVSQVPRFSEYQFGLSLAWAETNRTFDAGDVEQAVDFAVIWGICAAHDADAVKQMLAPFVSKKGVEWSAHMRVNDEALRTVAPVFAAADRRQFAGAMAAAMVGSEKGPGIGSAERRRGVYEPVWAFVLGEKNAPDPSVVSQVAQSRLRGQFPGQVFQEQNFANIDPLSTAAGTCRVNPDTRSNIDDFLRGMRDFALAVGRNDPDINTIPAIYKSLSKVWAQSHQVRAIGVRLLDIASDVSQLKGVERTLTVTAGEQAMTISSNPAGTV